MIAWAGATASASPGKDVGGPGTEGLADLLGSGRYEAVIASVDGPGPRRGRRADPPSNDHVVLAARAEALLGRMDAARRRLERALAKSPDDVVVRDAMLEVLGLVGDVAASRPLVDRTYQDWAQRRVDRRNPAALLAVARTVRLEGNHEDAHDLLRQAAGLGSPAASIALAELYLDKHDVGRAEAALRPVLASPPPALRALVLTVSAHIRLEQGYDVEGAGRDLDAALAANPRQAQALALRGQIALDAEDWAGADGAAAALRRTDAVDAGADFIEATRALLADDEARWQRVKAQRLGRHPGDGAFFARVASALERHRRYDEARRAASDGVAVAPADARCQFALGSLLLRLGDEGPALEALRRAWKADPYDVRTLNILELFEKVIPSRYVTFERGPFRFRVEAQTRPVIEAVVAPFLEATFADYVRRYGMTPRTPITFELFADPTHFAARTTGLPRLGVSAVCFGRVITSQSPTNAAFNWGMVLAHELAHVFALELSRHRVPRWFTEGLAEVETARLSPHWARHLLRPVWEMARRDALPSLADLSLAFLRARDGRAASVAYAAGALAVGYLERRHGFARVRQSLVDWGQGMASAKVLERLAAAPLAELDRAFRADLAKAGAHFDGQFSPDDDGAGPAPAVAAYRAGAAALHAGKTAIALQALDGLIAGGHDGFDVRLTRALARIASGDKAGAEVDLERARRQDPDRIEPYALLAGLLRDVAARANDRVAILEEAGRIDAQDRRLAKEIVSAHVAAGRHAQAAEAARRALFIDPADGASHDTLAAALEALGRKDEAAQARAVAARVRATAARP